MAAPAHLEREIREQPACLARLLAEGGGDAGDIAAAVRRFAPAFVVTAARGSSDNAARYAKYLFGAHNRLVVSLGAPSLVTLYDRAPSLERALVLGISQSGESPDIVALLAEGRRQGALTVAIVNRPDSPLAEAAAHVFPLRAGTEHAVAASKSYTCELLALAMLSAAIEVGGGGGGSASGGGDRWHDLAGIADAAERTLSLNASTTTHTAVAPFAGADRAVVVGRGFNFATAFEIALKIKELAGVMADPYAAPDLFHGPFAMIDADMPAILVAPRGAASADLDRALDALATRGARAIVLSDDGALLARDGVAARLPLAADVPEWLSPITAVLPGQLWALALARARGLDPDQPRGLAKITRTK
ncbi:MAG: SIS domain-containing protein [Bacteroidota bacterium]